jgi:hypothetical protein
MGDNRQDAPETADAGNMPDEVRSLVEHHFTSASQIEVLLLVHRSPDRLWDGAAVGGALGLDDRHAEQVLGRLARSGLVQPVGRAVRFAPRSARLGQAVEALARLHPTYRVAIVSMIYSRG